MLFKFFAALSFLVVMVSCDSDPHSIFVTKKICNILSETQLGKYNTIIKMSCDWTRFRDDNNNLIASKQMYRGSKFMYEIIFTPSPTPTDIEKYKIINKGLFSNFRLKSLSFQNLGIVKVETGAFDSYCCENSLETLDLSKNHLIRLDTVALKDLGRLIRLNLGNNFLSLSEKNFKFLRNLRYLDLSHNNIQYLPSNLLSGLTELELVNLDANNLRSIDACVFDLVQTSKLSRKLFPTKIELTQNPIDCDCDIFYLSRHRGYKVQANCASPMFYADKSFTSLNKEDPSKRCDYNSMEKACQNTGASDLLVCAVIILAVLSVFFFLFCLICCCKYMSAKDRAEQLQMKLDMVKLPPPANGTNYASGDKEKLLA